MLSLNIYLQCVCLGGCSSAYSNTALPSSSFSGPTAFGYWDDLYIYAGTSESVYYGTTGTAPNRNMVFEFYMSHYGASSQYYHFQIVFYENTPGVVRYYYYQDSDGGSSATIGTQGMLLMINSFSITRYFFLFFSASRSGLSMTYAYNHANAVPVGTSGQTTPTLTLTFNTNTNTYTSSG